MSAAVPWWKGAVVYQIYVRSFFDSNGDGHGDLPGITAKLEYITKLGADAIWLSPIHPSPNCDWGYDVSDYEGVHPDFGSPADFDTLLTQAQRHGIRVLLDGVLSHTSDQHRWFRQSLTSRDNPQADWYVWADPRQDGTPPNNWLSTFGGSAWSYHPARRQYFHHKFLRQQPKLNWRNANARAAALGILNYWLTRGVDGFRLDVANSYLHDELLADNPPVPLEARANWHWDHAPRLQRHAHDSNLRDNSSALDEIRRAVERHPNRFVFGEFFEDAEAAGGYLAPDKGLHSGYDFGLLELNALTAEALATYYQGLGAFPDFWPCVAFSNHDVVRTATRMGGEFAGTEFAVLALAVLLTLRGTILLYQGEELGLPNVEIDRHDIRDPLGLLYYPYWKGRDGCRTPMPWDGSCQMCNFTSGQPWLPIPQAHVRLSVAAQEKVARSPLHIAKTLISLRKQNASLRWGAIRFLDAKGALAFRRCYESENVLCVFNLAHLPRAFTYAGLGRARTLFCSGAAADGDSLSFAPFGFWIGNL